jgi:hypothetical protein
MRLGCHQFFKRLALSGIEKVVGEAFAEPHGQARPDRERLGVSAFNS